MTTLSTLYEELEDATVRDVKGLKVDNAELERLHDNPDIWYDTLVELKREVELQLTDKKREMHHKSIELQDDDEAFWQYQDEYNIWRVKVLRFLTSIESKLRYVKRARKEAYDIRSKDNHA